MKQTTQAISDHKVNNFQHLENTLHGLHSQPTERGEIRKRP